MRCARHHPRGHERSRGTRLWPPRLSGNVQLLLLLVHTPVLILLMTSLLLRHVVETLRGWQVLLRLTRHWLCVIDIIGAHLNLIGGTGDPCTAMHGCWLTRINVPTRFSVILQALHWVLMLVLLQQWVR